jgi:hypothetical protein
MNWWKGVPTTNESLNIQDSNDSKNMRLMILCTVQISYHASLLHALASRWMHDGINNFDRFA